tara:strand:+ start:102 stop:710 length:609 start_codon:yes stop_codon:yes gene_type:complete
MEKFKMKQTKKATWLTVLNDEQQVASDNAQSLMIQGAGSIEQSVEVSAETLGETPTLELWTAWFASLKTGWIDSKGVAEKTAEKYLTDTRAMLKDKYAMTKPQSEQAKAIAEKRAEQDKAFEHLSNAELVESIAVSTDKKDTQALTDILVKRNKASQKDEVNNAKELVKSSIKEITDWIKSDNSIEVQVSRAEKIMAFITKS